jgi:hypothetical protein
VVESKAFNGWGLFWVVTLPTSALMVISMMRADLSNGEAVSSMIQLSVRCAVPWLYLAFAASSVQILFPGSIGRWLLRNRKVLGLCFAAAMGWQLVFIVWLVTVYRDYYVAEVYVLRDVIEGVLGYLFLIAMTLTSFRFGRQLLRSKQWKLLHKSGMYFLWAYAFSVYWWELFYYPNPDWIDYVFYWTGLLAWGLRAAAWSKKQRQLAGKKTPKTSSQPAFVWIGAVLIGFGLIAASSGSIWWESVEEFLTGYSFTRIPELYLPYWPPIPFLPLFIIAAGVFLTTMSRVPRAAQP